MPRIEKQVIVLNKKGLCARASVAFIDIAKNFKSAVTVVKGKEQVNGKSAMGLLMLHAQYQNSLLLIVEGEDAQEAMKEFENFFTKEAVKVYPDSNFAKYLLWILGGLFLLVLIYFMLLLTTNKF